MAGKRNPFELGSFRSRALRELDATAQGTGSLTAASLTGAQAGPAQALVDAVPVAAQAASPLAASIAAPTQSGLSAFASGADASTFASGLDLAATSTVKAADAPLVQDEIAKQGDAPSPLPTGPVETPQANETLTVVQTTVLAPGGDTDGDGVIDPGETVLTTVTITNNSTDTTATGVAFTETLAGLTLAGPVNVSPLALNDTYSAVGNTLLEVGNATSQTGPQSSVAGSVFDNDREFLGDTFTLSSFQATSANGGTVNMLADGSFTYVSAAGFTGADTFTYTVRDKGLDGIAGNGDDLTSTATVTVNVANTVWYVDTNAATNGNGTSGNPFNTFTAINGAGGNGDVDGANSVIYVRGNATADIVLEAGQSLIGTGSALVVGGTTLAAAGANNTFTHGTGTGVLLSTNNTLSGFNVAGTNNAGTGIADGNGTVGTLTISNVNVTGNGQAIDIDQGGTLAVALGAVSSTGSASNGVHLQGVSGSFSATGGTIATSTGVGFLIGASGGGTASSGGNATISYGGAITEAGGASVEIQDRIGGTVTFSGAISETSGRGIVADGNAGTINFSGEIFINSGSADAIVLTNNSAAINFTSGGNGLDITTTTGRGFIVDGGGGTVILTGAGNTVQTGSGRAVEIDNVTIGGAGVTFQTVGISDGGSATGIFLRNAGSNGFSITGTGTTAGSGGTISSIDSGADGNTEQGIGIYIENTNNISLSNIDFTGDFANFGIRGFAVNNFTLRNSTMNSASTDDGGFGNSNAFDEGAISFSGLTGVGLFEGNNLSDGHEDLLSIDNSSGTLSLTVRDSAARAATVGRNGTTTGNDGILVNTSGTASVTALIEGVDFTGSRGDMIQFNASGTATQNITIRNNVMHNLHPDVVSGGGGVSITGGAGTGAGYNVTYRVEGNSMRGAEGTMLFINHLGDAGTVSGSIINNTIGNNNGLHSVVQADTGSNNGGNGIFIGLEHGTGAGNLTHAVLIQGNVIGDIRDGAGIFLRSNGDGIAGAGVTRLEATIRNNNIDEMGVNSLAGIYAQVGGAGANDDGLMGLNIENNNINLNSATNSIAALVLDDLAGNGQFYFPGYAGPYTDIGLAGFHTGPEGNTLAHQTAQVITSPTGTFATGNAFVLTVPTAAEALITKEDWEAALRIRQQAALDDHLGQLIADEESLLALAEALAEQGARVRAGQALDPLDPSPQAGETIAINIGALPNGRSVTIQWRSTVDAQSNQLIVNPVNSGTVTATNGAGFPDVTTGNVTTTLDTLTLGGTVYNDNGAGGGTGNNGLRDGTEAGIDGLTVAVFADANNDDVADTPGTALATTTTSGGGNYSFTGLAPGNYIVRVTPPAGLVSSAGSVDPDNNVDNDDNGNALAGGFISSNAITLAYNTEPTNNIGNDLNTTLDFALAAPDAEPTLTATAVNPNFNEDGGSVDLFSTVTASTIEAGQVFTSMTLTVTNVTDTGSEALAFDGANLVLIDGFSVLGSPNNNLIVNVSVVGTTATVTFTGAALSAADLQALVDGLRYSNTSQNPTDANRVVTITQLVDSGSNVAPNDNTAALNIASTVNVNPVNDAPSLDASKAPTLAAVNEDSGPPAGAVGTLVSALVDSTAVAGGLDNVTDPDGPNLGIAVTATNNANGSWFYSLNNGATWSPMGTVSDGSARLLLADGQTRVYFQPNTNYSGTLASAITFRAWDNSTGTNGGLGSTTSNGGTTAFSTATDTASLTVAAVNDAPSLDLDAGAAGTGASATFAEQGGGIFAPNASVSDIDSPNFDGGTVTVSYGANQTASDAFGISDEGGVFAGGGRIGVTMNNIYYNTVLIGTFTSGLGNDLVITLNASATPAAVQRLVQRLVVSNTSDAPPGGARALSVTVTDGDGGSMSAAANITITAVNDAPVNTVPGAQNGTEDTNLVFSTANGNAITIADTDASTLTVILSVTNGTLTLSGTAGLSFVGGANGSGTLIFSGSQAAINAALNGLTYRGNLNYEGNDTLSITTSDNGQTGTGGTLTDTDTVTITLADDGRITGDGGNNILNGTPGNDFFDLRQGGNDTVSGQGGDDGFYFGGAYTGADSVDGGAGNRDQIGLQGDYSAGVTLGTLTGVELVVLLSGADARFGDTANNRYDYNLTAPDSTVAAGQRLIIQANTLLAGEDLTFNGSAETNGSFLIYGGQGNDVLTGGAGNDGFYFGNGRFGAGDTVNGGAGTMDQLGLQGNFNLTFGAGQLSNVEFLVLLSASDNRFGSAGGTVGYTLTTNNANVAAGQTLVVSANTLQSGENLSFNGSAETDGRFEIFAGDGNDVLTGGAGNDLIFGGGRGDTLTGGAGNDIFAFRALTDSNSTERDGIQDFTLGDKIDLSRIDANLNLSGQQAFNFIGTGAFTNVAGQLRYENVSLGGPIYLIQGDANGDSVSDFELVYVLTDGHQLTVNDFIGVTGQGAAPPQEPLKLDADGAGFGGGLDLATIVRDPAGGDLILLDLGGPDELALELGGNAGGYLNMADAIDSGGPALTNVFDDLATAFADDAAGAVALDPLFGRAHDLFALAPTTDFAL